TIPKFDYLSPNVFFSSNQLWQGEFALGQWAPRHFGTPGTMLMSIYEAGYNIHSSFQQGLAWSGGGEFMMKVVNADGNNPHQMNIRPYLEEVKKVGPAFVHALFSGPLGVEFLQEWVASGLNKTIPLVVSEPMTYPEWLTDVQHLDLELYTASLYDPDDTRKSNQKFKKKFSKAAGQNTNVIALLGYEAGLLFKETYPYLKKMDYDKAKKLMQTETVKGPRGERNFYPDGGFKLPAIDIVKIKTSRSGIDRMVIGKGQALKYDETIFDDIRKAMPSGWQNPYFCY
ncbi:MAG: ABC transporter substrate-binding protein, partial [Cyclobacteriaceae bacterium]